MTLLLTSCTQLRLRAPFAVWYNNLYFCDTIVMITPSTQEENRVVVTEEIKMIQDIIIGAVPVVKLYLFGSYANGTPNEDSDFDFYVVIPNEGLRPVEAVQSIYRSFRGMKRKPMDILAGTVDTFERRSKQITLERTIADEGVLLYEESRSA